MVSPALPFPQPPPAVGTGAAESGTSCLVPCPVRTLLLSVPVRVRLSPPCEPGSRGTGVSDSRCCVSNACRCVSNGRRRVSNGLGRNIRDNWRVSHGPRYGWRNGALARLARPMPRVTVKAQRRLHHPSPSTRSPSIVRPETALNWACNSRRRSLPVSLIDVGRLRLI